MKLGSTRDLAGLKPVLKDSDATGPDPAYWVFTEISDSQWFNTTVTAPGRYNEPDPRSLGGGGEYPKTFGHYHPVDAVTEVYKVIEGEGIMLMQKKHLENGQTVPDLIEEVVLIKAQAGDEIRITPEWGHSWSNIGDLPLITFDNWKYGHSPTDYELIEKLHGMAYYLVDQNGQPTPIPNPNYHNLPTPQWLSASQFAEKYP